MKRRARLVIVDVKISGNAVTFCRVPKDKPRARYFQSVHNATPSSLLRAQRVAESQQYKLAARRYRIACGRKP